MFKKLNNSTSTEVKYNAVSLNKIQHQRGPSKGYYSLTGEDPPNTRASTKTGDTKRVEIIRSNCKGETVIERN